MSSTILQRFDLAGRAVVITGAGVRVNALAPGFFMTEQLRFLHVDQATGKLLPRAVKVIAHTPQP